MNDIGNSYLLESDLGKTDQYLLEDGSGVLLIESAPAPISFNNYEFVKADDGISVTEKIR